MRQSGVISYNDVQRKGHDAVNSLLFCPALKIFFFYQNVADAALTLLLYRLFIRRATSWFFYFLFFFGNPAAFAHNGLLPSLGYVGSCYSDRARPSIKKCCCWTIFPSFSFDEEKEKETRRDSSTVFVSLLSYVYVQSLDRIAICGSTTRLFFHSKYLIELYSKRL